MSNGPIPNIDFGGFIAFMIIIAVAVAFLAFFPLGCAYGRWSAKHEIKFHIERIDKP